MKNNTQTKENEMMNDPYAQHLTASVGETLDISDVLVESTQMFKDVHNAQRVLNGEIDGDKKESAVLIREVFGLKGNTAYKVCASTVGEVLSADGDSTPIAEYCIGIADGHVEVEDDDIEDVVEDVVAPADTSDFDAKIAAIEASFDAKINKLMDVVGTMATQQPVVEDEPTPAPKASVETETETVEYGLKTNRKRIHTPSIKNADDTYTRWSDKTNYTVGVITDTVDKINGKDGQHPCRHARGMTPEDATAMGRNIVRRRLTMRIKGLRAKTQGKDWAAVAAKHGITDAVCDEFITKPNKHALQARRTAANIRNRLGITNVVSFNEVADRFLNGDESPSEAPASKPSLTETTPSNGVATVDMAEVKKVMDTFGVGLDEAIAFLS